MTSRGVSNCWSVCKCKQGFGFSNLFGAESCIFAFGAMGHLPGAFVNIEFDQWSDPGQLRAFGDPKGVRTLRRRANNSFAREAAMPSRHRPSYVGGSDCRRNPSQQAGRPRSSPHQSGAADALAPFGAKVTRLTRYGAADDRQDRRGGMRCNSLLVSLSRSSRRGRRGGWAGSSENSDVVGHCCDT